jgi:hypothetical protein
VQGYDFNRSTHHLFQYYLFNPLISIGKIIEV